MKKKAKTKKVLAGLFAVSLIFGLFLISMVFSKFIVTEEKPPEEVDEQQVFIDSLSGHAQILYEKYHVLPSITLAQAILESDWGNSELAGKARNLFGVKGDYKGKHVTMNTDEFEKGKRKTIRAKFRKYSTFFESMDDHAKLFVNGTSWNKKKYKPVLEAGDYKTAAAALQKSGYATDPDYAEKIKDVIETYNLNEFDKVNESLKAVDLKGAIKDRSIEDVWSKPSKEPHSIKLASAQKFTGQHIKVVSEKQNGQSVWYQFQVNDQLIGWVDKTAVQLNEET
ncbi:glucosaminidase domain-containing protein [Bacillus sp. ISL-51]|uniref:glucosaminidase domain-containing protein n=1 Tax=Bacteria TaxID=2 RepID=UPI001BEC3B98|nr:MULTISPECIES: glucosaminidase domain-containing protein [Bacteria]MBT2575575.1 glucosaminidase domain-containing protein [Bacillus sp. ISL-51]MBT2635829.1 glucosaminidase domain-containing protein [Bacillus sp. ISL-26]MBT2711817.1 glucosaminidase domain-containing protein [Pseudomonas sp. ISL-88]